MFWFKKGKIAILLNKSTFSPGETIEGTLRIKLKKPVFANGLKVSLVGYLWTILSLI